MDEFGSSIRHSEEPNMKCAPFYYIPTNSMYTLIWPLTDIGFNGEFLMNKKSICRLT